MLKKITYCLCCLVSGLLFYQTGWLGAAPLEEPPVPEADSIEFFMHNYADYLIEHKLIDTAQNHIRGNLDALASVFEQLIALERWQEAMLSVRSGARTDTTQLLPLTLTEGDGTLSGKREESKWDDLIETPAGTDLVESSVIPVYEGPDLMTCYQTGIEPYPQVIPILHLGDSHVQGGFLTEPIRKQLQQQFGSAGRGLITPYKLMRTNQPSGYEISSEKSWVGTRCTELNPQQAVGVTGAAITTEARQFDFTVGSKGEPFNQIRVFHHENAPLLVPDPAAAAEIDCPWKDTPTLTHVMLDAETDRVTLTGTTSQKPYDVPVYHGFSLENGRSGVLYHAVGINGNTYSAVNRNTQMLQEAAALYPQLIIVSLGTNDAYGRNFKAEQVETQLRKLIAQCRSEMPESVILLTTPMECHDRVRVSGRYQRRPNPNVIKVRETIIEVAREEGLPYWDCYAATGGSGAMDRWHEHQLSRADKIHLTREGYTLQGDMFYQAFYEAYLTYKNRHLE